MKGVTLVVLAAGIGSRFGGLKQLSSVGPSGETIIDYSLYDALRAGFSKVVFIIRKEIESDFRRAIGDYWGKRVETAYVYQELDSCLPSWFSRPTQRSKPWGTGHAILNCLEAVKEPFAVINADDFYGPGAYREIHAYLKNDLVSPPKPVDTYCFVGYRLRNTLSEFGSVTRAICRVDDDGFLRSIVEVMKIEKYGRAARALDDTGVWTLLTGDEIASMNLWGFTPSVFSLLGEGFPDFLGSCDQDLKAEYLIPCAVFSFISGGKARVKYLPTSERWFGITYPEDLPGVVAGISRMVQKGIYPENIKA